MPKILHQYLSMLYDSRNKIFDSYKRRVSVIAVVKLGKLSLFIYPPRYFLNTSFYNVALVIIYRKVDAIDVMNAK